MPHVPRCRNTPRVVRLRPDAEVRPFDRTSSKAGEDPLTPSQQKLVTDITKRLGLLPIADRRRLPEPSSYGERVDITRSNRVFLLDGKRGSGKTTTLVSLIHAWQHQRSAVTQQKMAPMSKRLARGYPVLDPFVVPIHMIDLHPLPGATSILAQVLLRLRSVLEAITNPRCRADPCHGHPWLSNKESSKSLDAIFEQCITAAMRGWSAARSAYPPSPEEAAIDQTQNERERVEFPRLFRDLLEELAREHKPYRGCTKPDKKPDKKLDKEPKKNIVFLLPIDDADMNPSRVPELLSLLRLIWSPHLAFILTGSSALIEEVLRADFFGQMLGPLRHLCQEYRDPPHRNAEKLAVQYFDRTVPRPHRFELPVLTASESLGIVWGEAQNNPTRELLTHLGQRLGARPSELKAEAPSEKPAEESERLHPYFGLLAEALPRNLRKLTDLRIALESLEKQQDGPEQALSLLWKVAISGKGVGRHHRLRLGDRILAGQHRHTLLSIPTGYGNGSPKPPLTVDLRGVRYAYTSSPIPLRAPTPSDDDSKSVVVRRWDDQGKFLPTDGSPDRLDERENAVLLLAAEYAIRRANSSRLLDDTQDPGWPAYRPPFPLIETRIRFDGEHVVGLPWPCPQLGFLDMHKLARSLETAATEEEAALTLIQGLLDLTQSLAPEDTKSAGETKTARSDNPLSDLLDDLLQAVERTSPADRPVEPRRPEGAEIELIKSWLGRELALLAIPELGLLDRYAEAILHFALGHPNAPASPQHLRFIRTTYINAVSESIGDAAVSEQFRQWAARQTTQIWERYAEEERTSVREALQHALEHTFVPGSGSEWWLADTGSKVSVAEYCAASPLEDQLDELEPAGQADIQRWLKTDFPEMTHRAPRVDFSKDWGFSMSPGFPRGEFHCTRGRLVASSLEYKGPTVSDPLPRPEERFKRWLRADIEADRFGGRISKQPLVGFWSFPVLGAAGRSQCLVPFPKVLAPSDKQLLVDVWNQAVGRSGSVWDECLMRYLSLVLQVLARRRDPKIVHDDLTLAFEGAWDGLQKALSGRRAGFRVRLARDFQDACILMAAPEFALRDETSESLLGFSASRPRTDFASLREDVVERFSLREVATDLDEKNPKHPWVERFGALGEGG